MEKDKFDETDRNFLCEIELPPINEIDIQFKKTWTFLYSFILEVLEQFSSWGFRT